MFHRTSLRCIRRSLVWSSLRNRKGSIIRRRTRLTRVSTRQPSSRCGYGSGRLWGREEEKGLISKGEREGRLLVGG